METFDVVYIGGGPAGYVGAIRSAQLGFKTACVEKRKALGGTCLNIGCIPSKALLDSSEHFAFLKHKAAKHGLLLGEVKLDLLQMMKRKDQVVTGLTTGIAGLFKKNKIAHLLGHGRFTEPGVLEVSGDVAGGDGARRTISAKNFVIATGSDVARIPVALLDGVRVLSSTEALSLPEVPKTMIVIGGGAIGLEMGSVWMRLGAEVTVVEFNTRIATFADSQVSAELLKTLQRQGMKFKLGTKVLGVKNVGSKAVVEMEPTTGTYKESLEADVVLVAVGRKPYTENLGLDKIGIVPVKTGQIEIDAHFRTKAPGVYAVGDVVRGPMLAHKAEDEGIAVAEIIAGKAGHVNYECIPSVIYTWPELATVGFSEDECKARGIECRTGTFPFIANGRAKAMDEPEGLIKVIADARTDRLLGVHMVGPRASDMIAEAVMVMEFGGSAEDIALSTHAHPTLPEALKEAALAVHKRAIHF